MTLAEATVLVVDDEPVLNLTMSLVLQRTGARVLRAANGAEALAVLAAERVDVMVCDQNMPEMEGKTLLRTLGKDGRSVPTLLFTNGIEREDTHALSLLRVRRLLLKPIQPGTLIGAVAAVLAEV